MYFEETEENIKVRRWMADGFHQQAHFENRLIPENQNIYFSWCECCIFFFLLSMPGLPANKGIKGEKFILKSLCFFVKKIGLECDDQANFAFWELLQEIKSFWRLDVFFDSPPRSEPLLWRCTSNKDGLVQSRVKTLQSKLFTQWWSLLLRDWGQTGLFSFQSRGSRWTKHSANSRTIWNLHKDKLVTFYWNKTVIHAWNCSNA